MTTTPPCRAGPTTWWSSRPRPEVALVTLNRPDRLNALTSEMLAHIYDIFEALGRDATCRVIIVTGAGRGFCAGDDLRDYHPPHWVPDDVGPFHSHMYQQKYVAELVPRLRALPQPVIAAVNGPAAGAGYALALGADLRLASTSAVFVDAFVKIGASGAEMGLSWLLQRIVGATRAAELVLTGRRVDADEAARIGLVLHTVPDGDGRRRRPRPRRTDHREHAHGDMDGQGHLVVEPRDLEPRGGHRPRGPHPDPHPRDRRCP